VSPELFGLLNQLVDDTPTLRWTDVVMVSNVGAIPPARDAQGDFVWNRGFNLLIVGRWGRPRYFCKCRRAGDERLLREIRVMETLNGDPALRRHVPKVASGESSRLQILATRYVGARTLLEALHGPPRPAYEKLVMASVDAILTVSRHGTRLLAGMAEQEPVHVAREADPVFAYLERAGVASADVSIMKGVLGEVAPFPRVLQHGDAWPNNLIWRWGSVWMLDFEMFGEVQVPMYDIFHFLRTCSDVWASGGSSGGTWCDRMQGDNVSTQLSRRAARRAATMLGLTTDQTVAALIYYVAHFAATTHRRNPQGTFWERFLREVRRLADWLRQGAALDQVFLGR
jgi:Phosphotransferase enzyme family